MSGLGLFGSEGAERLRQRDPELFPRSVRPSFLRYLWAALLLLSVAAAAVLLALDGQLA